MEEILYYAIERRMNTEDGRLAEHETIVCSGSEIDCQRRIRELRKLQEENEKSEEIPQDMEYGGIQIEPQYFVVQAKQYDEEHSLNQQRSMVNKFMQEFGGKGGWF